MKVSLYVMINPRIEVLHLEEWILHNLCFGIDNIFIYNHGFICNDHSGKNQVGTWNRKPYLDFNLHLSDEEVTEQIEKIVSKYKKVEMVEWKPLSGCKYNRHAHCQRHGYIHCVKNNNSDWWIHIDPDEYLYSEKHTNIKNFLKDRTGAVGIAQVLFEYRKSHKPVVDHTHCRGKVEVLKKIPGEGVTKTLIKSDGIKRLEIHRPISNDKNTFVYDETELCYFHYKWNNNKCRKNSVGTTNESMKEFRSKIKKNTGNSKK
jgi:hypothetical protein